MACTALPLELNNILMNLNQDNMDKVTWNLKRTTNEVQLFVSWSKQPAIARPRARSEKMPVITAFSQTDSVSNVRHKKRKSAGRLARDRKRMRDFLDRKRNPIPKSSPTPVVASHIQNEAQHGIPQLVPGHDVTPAIEATNVNTSMPSSKNSPVSIHSNDTSFSIPSNCAYVNDVGIPVPTKYANLNETEETELVRNYCTFGTPEDMDGHEYNYIMHLYFSRGTPTSIDQGSMFEYSEYSDYDHDLTSDTSQVDLSSEKVTCDYGANVEPNPLAYKFAHLLESQETDYSCLYEEPLYSIKNLELCDDTPSNREH